MAEESFERGRMFWRGDDSKIVVLYSNGRWASYDDTWREGDPEYTCNTPQSPPTPKCGFGAAWCNHPEVHQGLGNAIDAERGYRGYVQEFDKGFVMQTDSGMTFCFYSNGVWDHR
jgi:hypothetical protein